MLSSLRKRFSTDMGIDLGTSNTLVYVRGKGIVLNEPTVVAIKKATGAVVAIGEQARRMEGRTPKGIRTIRPMKDGVIADIDVVEMMIQQFIRKVAGPRWSKPKIVVGIPSGITEVERRAVVEACKAAGAQTVWPIYESFAAAIGAGVPVFEPAGNLIVDIGGGTTEVSVISLGAMVETRAIRIGGNYFITTIVNHTRKRHNLVIGEPSAEQVYKEIGNAMDESELHTGELRGRDAVDGLPRTVIIDSQEIREALREPIGKVLDVIRVTLDATPPELAADIVDRGIYLAGGGSMLRGLAEYIAQETKVPVRLAPDPLLCVVKGTGTYLELKLSGDKRVEDDSAGFADTEDE